jgi:rubrerythrin
MSALELLEKMPKEEKASIQYNKLMSLSLDSLRRYESAIRYYQLYSEQSGDSSVRLRLTTLKVIEEKRLEAIRVKFAKIKDCPKCHGTDSIPTDIVCPKCNGYKQIKKRCSSCYGKGYTSCSSCGGKGSINMGKDQTFLVPNVELLAKPYVT